MSGGLRSRSFAQDDEPSPVDRFGRWLSTARMKRLVGDVHGKRAADIGCGYDAALARILFEGARSVLVVDIAIDPAVGDLGFTRLEGYLPDVLSQVDTNSIDVLISNNVIEHLLDPLATLQEYHRLVAPGGVCVVNVPSWRGKRFLELAAFRLGVAPRDEMDDHRMYYDPRDLWPLLVEAGFRPSHLNIHRHKGGLNTIARCGLPADGGP